VYFLRSRELNVVWPFEQSHHASKQIGNVIDFSNTFDIGFSILDNKGVLVANGTIFADGRTAMMLLPRQRPFIVVRTVER
jgi:hypothetical protein